MGSCNGCRVLRKGCGNTCVLRPCLEWIQSPDSQAHATLFLSKFFGRSDLINYISSAPADQRRTDLFRSLLYEAVGRTVNPINGAAGLMATGNWHLIESAVRLVLAGGTPVPFPDGILIPEVDESSDVFISESAKWTTMMMMMNTQIDGGAGTSNNAIAVAPPPPNVVIAEGSNRDNFATKPVDDVAADVLMSFRQDDGVDPKMWKLFG